MTTREELHALWSDPRYWTPPGIYRCPQDPRVIVPKRRQWAGWTINFAHPWATPVLVLSVVITIGPTLVLSALGKVSGLGVALTMGGSVLLLVLGSHWEATRPR